jgi:hypothetical protein
MSPSQASETCASASSATSAKRKIIAKAVAKCQGSILATKFTFVGRHAIDLLSHEDAAVPEVTMTSADPRTAIIKATVARIMAVYES